MNAPQVTHFYTGDVCPHCGKSLYSDGRRVYCHVCGAVRPPPAAAPDGVTLLHKTLAAQKRRG